MTEPSKPRPPLFDRLVAGLKEGVGTPPDTCPLCSAQLLRDDGFRDLIGHELPEVYDGALYWQCKQCSGVFHRWPEGDPLREAAEPYVSPRP